MTAKPQQDISTRSPFRNPYDAREPAEPADIGRRRLQEVSAILEEGGESIHVGTALWEALTSGQHEASSPIPAAIRKGRCTHLSGLRPWAVIASGQDLTVPEGYDSSPPGDSA